MAEESELEKTEPASERKLEQARESGDVPRSRELATCTILLAAGAGFWATGDTMLRQLNHMLTSGLTLDRAHAYDIELLNARIAGSIGDLLLAFAPLAGILMLVALASPMLIGGWLFSSQALQPKFCRLNPLSGIANLISKNSLSSWSRRSASRPSSAPSPTCSSRARWMRCWASPPNRSPTARPTSVT